MNWTVFLPYLAVTAGVTYLIRMLPLTIFRKEIKSRFIRSFLTYIPYAVLGAMTFPDVIFCSSRDRYCSRKFRPGSVPAELAASVDRS